MTNRLKCLWGSNYRYALLGLAIAVIASVFLLIPRQSVEPRIFEDAAKVPNGPSIAVFQFRAADFRPSSGQVDSTNAFATGLQFELLEKLWRFKNLRVIQGSLYADSQLLNVARDLQALYYLSGNIQLEDEKLTGTVVLARTSDASIVWSRSFDETITNAAGLSQIESSIAISVASALGQPYSRLNMDFTSEADRLSDMDLDHYLCLNQFYAYVDNKSEQEHRNIRDCLERATNRWPNFSSGLAALSRIYGDEERNAFNRRPEDSPPMDRALQAATSAIEAAPDNPMAYQYHAIASFAVGNDDAFRRSAETALRLNPNDPEILADVGSHLIQLDLSETGQQMVEKALALNPDAPSWYHGSISMYHYMKGEPQKALEHALTFSENRSLLSQILLTVSYVRAGNVSAARDTYKATQITYPHFETDYASIVESWRLPAGMAQFLFQDLEQAGFVINS